MPVLHPSQGLLLLVAYGGILVTLTFIFTRRRRQDRDEFLLAGRNIGPLAGAMSIAASWIWAPALFISSQKAFDQGIAGFSWFLIPNIAALLVFAPLALRIRKVLPNGFTLPQFIHQRHGRAVHILYMIQFLGLQICSFAVQILAGSKLIEQLCGLDFHLVALILVIITLAYSLLGGVRASVITDVLQMGLILGIALVTVPMVVNQAGGFETVINGLGGKSAEFGNLFDPWIAYSFGIPVTVGLLAGPIGDQMHWQRAYLMRSNRDLIKAFSFGALLFAIVPITLSLLGFVAAGLEPNDWNRPESSQLIGPLTVIHLLRAMTLPFCIMLLSGLGSTLDSILCAVSSLAAVDLAGSGNTDASADQTSSQNVRTARISMLLAAFIGLAIAFIPGLQILHLFLFYGTWRASTMIPTIFSLYAKQLDRRAVFLAILASLLLGAPIYAAGAVLKNAHLSVLGVVLVLAIGTVTCWIGTRLQGATNAPRADV